MYMETFIRISRLAGEGRYFLLGRVIVFETRT
jgi:hypothetical protein